MYSIVRFPFFKLWVHKGIIIFVCFFLMFYPLMLSFIPIRFEVSFTRTPICTQISNTFVKIWGKHLFNRIRAFGVSYLLKIKSFQLNSIYSVEKRDCYFYCYTNVFPGYLFVRLWTILIFILILFLFCIFLCFSYNLEIHVTLKARCILKCNVNKFCLHSAER